MTDKVQKIREEVVRLKLCTMDEHMKFYSECAEAEYNALCKVEEIIDSLQEEPVSESLIDGIVKEAITWTWGEYCNELDTFRISKKDLRTFTQSIIYSLGEKGIKI